MTLDEGFGWTFDAHVTAGYKFIMQYYETGDKIYMFGFSRGAYTARYLARMINTVGLLSKGNEEMVPFAYKLYQDYELGRKEDGEDLEPPTTTTGNTPNGSPVTENATRLANGTVEAAAQQDLNHRRKGRDPQQMKRNKLQAFTQTFCRRERTGTGAGWSPQPLWTGVKVYFLGIFDCVNSVAVLETSGPKHISIVGTAQHVRHAVAVDEFRVKFRASLLAMDRSDNIAVGESHREVWFPGNHGDVGGGWPAPGVERGTYGTALWKRLQRRFPYLFTDTEASSSTDQGQDPYQLSDVPLSWMIRELETLQHEKASYALTWSERLQDFKKNFIKRGVEEQQALKAACHNTLRIGGGSGLVQVVFWQIMENIWFFLSRRAFVDGKWVSISFWPNWSSPRDIPASAELHQSLKWRLENVKDYKPKNEHGRGTSATGPCLVPEKFLPFYTDADGLHSTYQVKPDQPGPVQPNLFQATAVPGRKDK